MLFPTDMLASGYVEYRQPPAAEGQVLDGAVCQLGAVGQVQSLQILALLGKLLHPKVCDLVAL